MSHPFEVGKTYRNRRGEYVVQTIDGDRMKIRYKDGGTLETRVDLQARIWENIQFEEQLAREEERQRLAREARREARRRIKRVKSKPEFEGFEEGEFHPTKRRIAWSGREDMGKVLAYELSRGPIGAFYSWIVPRESGVHVARSKYFDRDDREHLALFFVKVDEHGIRYGFRVAKGSGEAKPDSHWAGFLAALDEVPIRQAVRPAMDSYELHMDVYAMTESFGRVARITAQDGGFLWQHETEDQETTREMDWDEVVEYLQGVASDRRGEVRLQRTVSPEVAIRAGKAMATEIVDACKELVPLYDACVGA